MATATAVLDASQVSVRSLKGVGPQLEQKLQKLGICSLLDLLLHLPASYQDRTTLRSIASLRSGESAALQVTVESTRIVFGRRRSLLCRVRDDTGTMVLRFFHFSRAQQQTLSEGRLLRCFGAVTLNQHGPELIHPEYQFIDNASVAIEQAAHFTAIYPATEGLSQSRMRALVAAALARLDGLGVATLIPTGALPQFARALPADCVEQLRRLHQPPLDADITQLNEHRHPLQRLLAFEELVALRLSQLLIRHRQRSDSAPPLQPREDVYQQFVGALPFSLTDAQQRVWQQLRADLAQATPMRRLVQGDVGSGKTVVAALAALQAICNLHQVALMAPTEILAEQHLSSFRQWFEPLKINVELLTSKMPAAAKRKTIERVASGEVSLVIGTHALVQDPVTFANLGLVVIDEQHRFGVNQRKLLQSKRPDTKQPHQLIMSATPIPRTMAMTLYADLDYSVIDRLPPGRLPVHTAAISTQRRGEVIEAVAKACAEHRQVYWVCTLIEESDALDAQAAEAATAELREQLPQLAIELLHGRHRAEEKKRVMESFSSGLTQVLVSTTVIEVGVDVANASLMIIENAERLGLAQLHQLRGRVGRGSAQSHCILLYQQPLSKTAKQRIESMRSTHDGFKLAELDLQMRGPGDVMGTAQSGDLQLHIAEINRDSDMLDEVVALSDRLAVDDAALAQQLVQRWRPLAADYSSV